MTRAGPCSVSGLRLGQGGAGRASPGPGASSLPSRGRCRAGARRRGRVRSGSHGSVASTSCPIPVVPGAVSRPARSGDEDATGVRRTCPGGTPAGMSTWRPLTTGVTAQPNPRQIVPAAAGASQRAPGVAGRVDLAQPVDGDQRVDLRRRHRRVPEQLLHDAHVGAAVEQVGRERVPQRVRRHLRASSPARSAAARRTVHALCRDSAAAAGVEEQRPRRTPRRPGGQRRPGPDEVVLDGPQRVAADRDDPLLAALAGQPHRRPAAVEVVDGEPDRLGDARAGAVQQLEQRPVAQRARALDRPAASSSATTARPGSPWAAGAPARAAAPRRRRRRSPARRAARTGAARAPRPPPAPPRTPTAAGGRRRPCAARRGTRRRRPRRPRRSPRTPRRGQERDVAAQVAPVGARCWPPGPRSTARWSR